MQSNTTMPIKVYLMAILDNYMFRPSLAVFRLSSRELKVLLYTLSARTWCRDLYIRALLHNVISICGGMLWLEALQCQWLVSRPVCRDLCTTCALNVYSRTLSSLEENLKMASEGRNMQLSSIAIKYTTIGIVVFDYIPFPIFTHNGDDTILRFLYEI